MILTFSIENREIIFGCVKDGCLVDTMSISYIPQRTPDEYACKIKAVLKLHGITISEFDGAIGSSVVPSATGIIRSALEYLLGFKVHILGAGAKTGLNILIDDPAQLGGDLVALSVGALTKYRPPMVLIDFGTATTFCVIDPEGRFVGCAIAPGVEISLNALSDGAGLLPHISRSVPKKCIGTNTIESMQSGAIFGNSAMIDGMIERIEREMKSPVSVVASGSMADVIIPHCAREVIRDDTLIFFGLAKIYEKNSRFAKPQK